MSRWGLVLTTSVALAAGPIATAAPRTMIIRASDNRSDEAQRQANVQLIKRELRLRLADVTCDGCQIDACVTRLDIETSEAGVAVSAAINIAISDHRGVMTSVLTGGARAELSHALVGAPRLAALRDQALTAAVDLVSAKVASRFTPRRAAKPESRGLPSGCARRGRSPC